MSASKPPATVYDILQIQPGDKDNPAWVNDEFEAVVSNVRPGQGRKPTKATLSDAHNPNVSVLACFFGGRNVASYQGKLCLFSGQGMTMKEYNGTPELNIGDKATVHIIGAHTGSPAAASTASRSSGPTTARDDTRGGGHEEPRHDEAPKGPTPVNGQTVGMAMKEAIGLVSNCGDSLTFDDLNAPAFWKQVHATCSDIIRVSRLLESGKLAPSAKDRADPDFEKKQAAATEAARIAAEEAERKRKEAEEAERKRREMQTRPAEQENLDEDVPF